MGLTEEKNSDGGFFLTCEDFGGGFKETIPCLHPFPFFCFKVEISLHALVDFLSQDQSVVAEQAETTVDKHSLTSCT